MQGVSRMPSTSGKNRKLKPWKNSRKAYPDDMVVVWLAFSYTQT